jgi:fluoroquinolone resistance protein
MDLEYAENQIFKSQDYTENELAFGEYENCIFSSCIFANTDFSHFVFIDCVFDSCDLSMVKLKETAFKDVKFKNSKLLGLRFDDCNDFLLAVNFENCDLSYSSFYKLTIKSTLFDHCKLEDVDFSEANISNSSFYNTNLLGTTFSNTIIEGADFRSAEHFNIDLDVNKVKNAKFSPYNVHGLLTKYKVIVD